MCGGLLNVTMISVYCLLVITFIFLLCTFRIVASNHTVSELKQLARELDSVIGLTEVENQQSTEELGGLVEKKILLTTQIETLENEIATESMKMKAIQEKIETGLKPQQIQFNMGLNNAEREQIDGKIKNALDEMKNLGTS